MKAKAGKLDLLNPQTLIWEDERRKKHALALVDVRRRL